MKGRRLVRIKNPLSEDFSVMRTTMIYGLLETAKKNAITALFDLRIFEIGRIFLSRKLESFPKKKTYWRGF